MIGSNFAMLEKVSAKIMNMTKTISYRQLFELLQSLGFEDRSNAKHIAFVQDDEWKRYFLFGRHGLDAAVFPHDILKVRGLLNDTGILDAEAFDSFVDATAKLPA